VGITARVMGGGRMRKSGKIHMECKKYICDCRRGTRAKESQTQASSSSSKPSGGQQLRRGKKQRET
jgi:hypothetical protein